MHGGRPPQPTGPNSRTLDHPDPSAAAPRRRPAIRGAHAIRTNRRSRPDRRRDRPVVDESDRGTPAIRDAVIGRLAVTDHRERRGRRGLTAPRPPSRRPYRRGPPVPIPNTAVKPAGPMIVPLARKSVIAGSFNRSRPGLLTGARGGFRFAPRPLADSGRTPLALRRFEPRSRSLGRRSSRTANVGSSPNRSLSRLRGSMPRDRDRVAEAVEGRPQELWPTPWSPCRLQRVGDRFELGAGEEPALGGGEAAADLVLELGQGGAEGGEVALDDGRQEPEQDEPAEPVGHGVGDRREVGEGRGPRRARGGPGSRRG